MIILIQLYHTTKKMSTQTTRPCRFYNTQKGCANGDSCKFEHTDNFQNNKTRTCKFFAKGNCTKGEECSFSHEQPLPKSETPCRFAQSGGCKKGDTCEFQH